LTFLKIALYFKYMINSNQKITIFLSALLILSASALIAEVEIIDFHARLSKNNTVVLEWSTAKEVDLDHFNIFRSTDGTTWNKINELKSKQGNSFTRRDYKYIDNTVFKSSTGSFSYKLSGIDKNGTLHEYPAIENVSVSSGIKHTWGSIKAMFR